MFFRSLPSSNEKEAHKKALKHCSFKASLAYLRGFEPLTFWSVAKRSIQLS